MFHPRPPEPHRDVGTEVVVLWGDPGMRQKEIRATVSRFPYLDENRNEHVDVSRILAPLRGDTKRSSDPRIGAFSI
jgi:hypothetical protein